MSVNIGGDEHAHHRHILLVRGSVLNRRLHLIPDGLRQKADDGDRDAQRQLCEVLANQLEDAEDVDQLLRELEHYAALLAKSGEHADLCILVWVYGFRAGLHQGEDEEIFAVADAVVVIDEMADVGFEDAPPALYAVADLVNEPVAEEAFALAGAIRSIDEREEI